MEEIRVENLREKGYDAQDEAFERAKADSEAAALRGDEAKNSILGEIGCLTDAMKSKLSMPSEIADEKRRNQKKGGEEKIVAVIMEESSPGAAPDLLKVADQITGKGYTMLERWGRKGRLPYEAPLIN
ncbi:late embryogenesis abundant protein ECP63-like isoform X2 [Spinacia oleracea]|nr:late embryogenesis abundant protein ECP63-like isoform X2 [Spinacia oleracea]